MGPLQRIKDSFVAGLILVAPLAITLYVFTILVNGSLQFINPLVAEAGLAQWSVSRHLFGNLGRTVNFVPLVSTIYTAVKQVATSPVDRDSEYESGVLVEYPREGMRMIVTTGISDNEAELAARASPSRATNRPVPGTDSEGETRLGGRKARFRSSHRCPSL